MMSFMENFKIFKRFLSLTLQTNCDLSFFTLAHSIPGTDKFTWNTVHIIKTFFFNRNERKDF